MNAKDERCDEETINIQSMKNQFQPPTTNDLLLLLLLCHTNKKKLHSNCEWKEKINFSACEWNVEQSMNDVAHKCYAGNVWAGAN